MKWLIFSCRFFWVQPGEHSVFMLRCLLSILNSQNRELQNCHCPLPRDPIPNNKCVCAGHPLKIVLPASPPDYRSFKYCPTNPLFLWSRIYLRTSGPSPVLHLIHISPECCFASWEGTAWHFLQACIRCFPRNLTHRQATIVQRIKVACIQVIDPSLPGFVK